MAAAPRALVFLAGRLPLQGLGCLPPHQGEVRLSPGLGGLFTHAPPEIGVPGYLHVGNSAFCTVPAPWTQGLGAARKAVDSPRLLFPGSFLSSLPRSEGAHSFPVHPGPPAQASPPTWRCSRSAGCKGPGRWDHQAGAGANVSVALVSHCGSGTGPQARTGACTHRRVHTQACTRTGAHTHTHQERPDLKPG